MTDHDAPPTPEPLRAVPTDPDTAPDADAADDSKGEGRKVRNGGYLPVLPEGWAYGVQISGPSGQVRIFPDTGTDWVVAIQPHGEDPSRQTVDSLGAAVRAGVDAARALNRLAQVEAAYEQARRDALSAIGGGEAEPAE